MAAVVPTVDEKDKATATAGPEVEPYNPYRFNSKRWDPATSSYDMGFRDYSPGLNRFLTRDMYNGALADLKLGSDPWNTNRYAFAGGNPITGIELDGHCPMGEKGGCDDNANYEGPVQPTPTAQPKSTPEPAPIQTTQEPAPHPDRFFEMAGCSGGPGCVLPEGFVGKYGSYRYKPGEKEFEDFLLTAWVPVPPVLRFARLAGRPQDRHQDSSKPRKNGEQVWRPHPRERGYPTVQRAGWRHRRTEGQHSSSLPDRETVRGRDRWQYRRLGYDCGHPVGAPGIHECLEAGDSAWRRDEDGESRTGRGCRETDLYRLPRDPPSVGAVMMTAYVELYLRRNRGWPLPEDSWGLTPMFGEDGWCRSCGVPKHPQTGSIVLQRKSMKVEGGWVPNWRFDAICLEGSLAEEAASRFRLDLFQVDWHGSPPGKAMQIVVPTVGEAWFDREELRVKAIERHGSAGARCADCGTWRWMPLAFGTLPPLRIEPGLGDVDIAASPEWFGDGWKAYRQILVRRELAEQLAATSPKDFKVQPVT